MNPKDVAEAYFASVRAKDLDAFARLLASDAVFVFPDGAEHVGREAIVETERAVFASHGPVPQVRSMILGDRSVAAEVDVTVGDKVLQGVNLFYLNETGLIQRLASYKMGW